MHEGVAPPFIEHSPIAMLVLFLVLFCDHLPLGKVADHNSAFNQFVAYQMGCLVQAILLFVALLFRDALVDLR